MSKKKDIQKNKEWLEKTLEGHITRREYWKDQEIESKRISRIFTMTFTTAAICIVNTIAIAAVIVTLCLIG